MYYRALKEKATVIHWRILLTDLSDVRSTELRTRYSVGENVNMHLKSFTKWLVSLIPTAAAISLTLSVVFENKTAALLILWSLTYLMGEICMRALNKWERCQVETPLIEDNRGNERSFPRCC
jgi:hypothetical protein